MLDSLKGLTEKLLPKKKIFVGKNALVFFDVNNPAGEPINIREIKNNKQKRDKYGPSYIFICGNEENYYFINGGYMGRVETISYTNPCVVFCAFTSNENGKNKASGVYHAYELSKKERFKNRLHNLIDTVRPNQDEKVTVKCKGAEDDEEYLQNLREDITALLTEKGVEINPSDMTLGGTTRMRTTRFMPYSSPINNFVSSLF